MDWNEKIASQLFQGNQAFLSDLPRAFQAQENDEWLKNKAEELKNAISETIIFMRNLIMEINRQCDDEDTDKSTDMSLGAWENEYFYGNNRATSRKKRITELSVSEDDIRLFLDKLQYNLVFDMGFKVADPRNEYKNKCYCPFSNQMEPLRKYFFPNGISGKWSR